MRRDKPITVDGCTATPRQQSIAWRYWFFMGGGDRELLASELAMAGLDDPEFGRVCITAASRMLQKARKAGEIRFNGRVWEPVRP